jgi:phosphomannomutase
MSSSRALSDITRKHGGEYTASAVGEVNVVAQMKKVNAVIGGEGNGGVIYPACHSGRDALVGVALFLSHMAKMEMSVSAYRQTLPEYYVSKNRIDLTPETDIDAILARVKNIYKEERVNDIDGIKIDFTEGWVHLRKSNTEPIIRVYSEAGTIEKANALAQQVMAIINE